MTKPEVFIAHLADQDGNLTNEITRVIREADTGLIFAAGVEATRAAAVEHFKRIDLPYAAREVRFFTVSAAGEQR